TSGAVAGARATPAQIYLATRSRDTRSERCRRVNPWTSFPRERRSRHPGKGPSPNGSRPPVEATPCPRNVREIPESHTKRRELPRGEIRGQGPFLRERAGR